MLSEGREARAKTKRDGTGGREGERAELDGEGRKSRRKGNHMAIGHVLHRWK